MAKTNVVAGIDVGTNKVVVTTGQYQEGLINITGVGNSVNTGMRKGLIIDIEDTVSSITGALEEAEKMSGTPITNAIVGINGGHITSSLSHGVVAVSRADGEITEADVQRVIEAARTVALPPNREIIHVIPKTFIVDGQKDIKDPVGMTGIRLEVETLVIGTSTSALRNLNKCVTQAGLTIDDMIYGPLAAAKILLNKKQKEMGAALVDIGAGTTSITIFEEGDLIHANVLPIGSMHITNDIAIGLRTSLDTAEKIKLKFGHAKPENVRETDTIRLSDFDPDETQKVSRKYVAEIIEARLNEIFTMIKKDLKSLGKEGTLPAGVIFTGGGAKLEGLNDFAKESLKLPAQLGKMTIEISGMVDKLDNPIYSTSVGLVLWGLEGRVQNPKSGFELPKIEGNLGKAIDKIKDIFKQFLP